MQVMGDVVKCFILDYLISGSNIYLHTTILEFMHHNCRFQKFAKYGHGFSYYPKLEWNLYTPVAHIGRDWLHKTSCIHYIQLSSIVLASFDFHC